MDRDSEKGTMHQSKDPLRKSSWYSMGSSPPSLSRSKAYSVNSDAGAPGRKEPETYSKKCRPYSTAHLFPSEKQNAAHWSAWDLQAPDRPSLPRDYYRWTRFLASIFGADCLMLDSPMFRKVVKAINTAGLSLVVMLLAGYMAMVLIVDGGHGKAKVALVMSVFFFFGLSSIVYESQPSLTLSTCQQLHPNNSAFAGSPSCIDRQTKAQRHVDICSTTRSIVSGEHIRRTPDFGQVKSKKNDVCPISSDNPLSLTSYVCFMALVCCQHLVHSARYVERRKQRYGVCFSFSRTPTYSRILVSLACSVLAYDLHLEPQLTLQICA